MTQFPDEFWNALELAVLRLDQAETDSIDLEQFLPAAGVSYRDRLLVALVKIDQERCWRRQDRRRLEQYLERWPELREDDDLLAELVRAESRIRSGQDDPLDADELYARFPEAGGKLDFEQLCREDNGHVDSVLTDSPSLLATICSGELFQRAPKDQPALPRGYRLGRYRVLSVLGRGGMGTVYLAEDEELDRSVAVKLLHPWITSDQDTDALLAEARTAAKLRHPGIVPVYDVGRDESGACFFVMEYVEGESLADVIISGKLTRDRVISISSQMAETLAAAHRQGLIHRDIKPANVLIDADGRARITDFGLAVHEQDRTKAAGDISGTLPYMAPEQVRGDQQDPRTDLWALGVVLYEMLTGQRPFTGNSWKELSEAIQQQDPTPPRSLIRGIPRALERVTLRCLSKEPDGRHADAATFLDQIHRIQRPSRARRAAASILVVLAAVVVAVWIWATSGWEPPDVNISEVRLHPWLADCDLVYVAHIGAEIDLDKAERLMASQRAMTESHLYVSVSDAIDVSVNREPDGWLTCEFPLSVSYNRGIPEGAENQSSSGMGPDSISMRLRLAFSPDGVIQFGTVGDDPNEHLLTLMLGSGIDNSTAFSLQPLSQQAVGGPHNWILEADERQNQFADWFAQIYRMFHENEVVRNGPRHHGDLYRCPIELRSFFEKEIIVVYGRIAHQQFDYNWHRPDLEWVDRATNEAWSPIADDPDQDATLKFDVALRFPGWKPEHSALFVLCQSDNNNDTGFTVEGLTFDLLDRYHEFDGQPGEHTSVLKHDEEAGTCTGSETNIAAVTLILYGEAPSRIELEATTTWSTVHPWFKYATFAEGEIELDAESSPTPPSDRQIAPRIWRIPPTRR